MQKHPVKLMFLKIRDCRSLIISRLYCRLTFNDLRNFAKQTRYHADVCRLLVGIALGCIKGLVGRHPWNCQPCGFGAGSRASCGSGAAWGSGPSMYLLFKTSRNTLSKMLPNTHSQHTTPHQTDTLFGCFFPPPPLRWS